MERLPEALLLVVALNSGLQLLQAQRAPGTPAPSLLTLAKTRLAPWAALLIAAALLAGSVVQLFWSGALPALQREDSGPWWRTLTAPFVQDSGWFGAVFNILTALLVLALVEWIWGHWIAAALWLIGAWAPIGDLAKLLGYRVSSGDTAAYSSGSSGATFFAAAALAIALLVWGTGKDRLLGLVAPVVAAAMWWVANDGHGVVFIDGVILAAVLAGALLLRRVAIPRPAT